jgi:hypothetical protein
MPVFKWMKAVSHREHREHREHNEFSVLSVLSVAIHPHENCCIERKCVQTSDVRSSGRIIEKLICHTASRHIPFQQVLGAQHRPLENEHRPPSGIQVCRPALATEVKGVKKTPITINRAPAIFNNEVFFICFSPLFRYKLFRYKLLRYRLH